MKRKVQGAFIFWTIFTVFADSSGEDDSGEISVPRRPRILGQSTIHKAYFVGDKLEDLICDIEGSPTPSVVWLKDGKRDMEDEFESDFDGKEGIAILSFKDDVASPKSEGNYSCVAGNFLGRASKTFSISVAVAPTPQTSSSSTSPTSLNDLTTQINSSEDIIIK